MRALAVSQCQDAGPRLDRLIALRTEVEIFGRRPPDRLGRPVESDNAACESIFDIGRQRPPFYFQARDYLQKTPRVPQFEGAEFVTVAPTHGAIDFHDAIRNLGDHLRAVQEIVTQDFPQEAARAVIRAQHGPHALAQIFNVARGLDRRPARLLERLVFQRLPIERVDLAILSYALVEALAGLVAQPLLLDHLLLEIERQEE